MEKIDLDDLILEVRHNAKGLGMVYYKIKHRAGFFQKFIKMPLLVTSVAMLALELILLGAEMTHFELSSIGDLSSAPFLLKVRNALLYDSSKINNKIFTAKDGRIYRLLFLALTSFFTFCRNEQEDSMLVVKDVGIQLKSVPTWKFSRKETQHFFPLRSIIDLVIHEGFHGYGQVIFYMCVLSKPKRNSEENSLHSSTSSSQELIKVVFPQFLPRKDILIRVWKESRTVLFGSTRRYFRRVPGEGLRECS